MATHETSTRTTREAFMARIHAALEHADTQPPAEAAPVVDESIARLARPTDDLLTMFCGRATFVGMSVERIKSVNLLKSLVQKARGLGAKKAVVSVGTLAQGLGLKDALRKQGIDVVDWKAKPGLGCQFDCDIGITDVHAALAETGTLVCCSDAGHSRGLSLVPPVHLAVVRKSDILPDMIDYWARQKGIPSPSLPSSIAFITGPSKTADIEGVLVTGVHGPGKVFVYVVEDA